MSKHIEKVCLGFILTKATSLQYQIIARWHKGAYNDTDSMANKLRCYPALDKNFLAREDVQEFVKAWAKLWHIDSNEPILMQITGVKGEQSLDPLQGQGIHQDGSQFLSIVVLNRDNVTGG